MTLDEFAAITRKIIARDGFDYYLPTAYFPNRAHIAVLGGEPENSRIEKDSLAWAIGKASSEEEVLVAFKSDAKHFKIIRRIDGRFETGIYAANIT